MVTQREEAQQCHAHAHGVRTCTKRCGCGIMPSMDCPACQLVSSTSTTPARGRPAAIIDKHWQGKQHNGAVRHCAHAGTQAGLHGIAIGRATLELYGDTNNGTQAGLHGIAIGGATLELYGDTHNTVDLSP